jgi:hypothetical protein
VRPRGFEPPRPIRVTRPSTLRHECALCPMRPSAALLSTSVDDMDVIGGVDVVKVLSRIICQPCDVGASERSDDYVGKPGADSRAGSLLLSRAKADRGWPPSQNFHSI